MDDDLRLCAVPSSTIEYFWEVVQPMINAALKHADGKYSENDIFRLLKEKNMQLWVIADIEDIIQAAIVTQIVEYPNKKVMFIVLVGGVKFDNWSHVLPHFVSFARDHQCQSIEGYGRSGWETKLKHLGFKKILTVYRFPVEE